MKAIFPLYKLVVVSLLLSISALSPSAANSQAQDGSRNFPETGKTVGARFLQYWNTHGGLPQQGYPISELMQERSDTDGKTYTIQYFERTVFELHPENQAPNDVLLSLLGVFAYSDKYGASGAPNQVPNTQVGSQLFTETGKRVGGEFLAYWQTHGGVAQQGLPISDQFYEVSPLNGQRYLVQYFERAVFELHPENDLPYKVLLSQLGTFRYRAKYLSPAPSPAPSTTPTSTPVTQPDATSTSTATANPANTPSAGPVGGLDCSGLPQIQNLVVTPNCAAAGATFYFLGSGFKPGENVGVYVTNSEGQVYGTQYVDQSDGRGTLPGFFINTRTANPVGIWTATMEGLDSHRKAFGYFKVAPPPSSPDCTGIPPSPSGKATPSCAVAGSTVVFEASGFHAQELVGVYYTSPSGLVYPAADSGSSPDGLASNVSFKTNLEFERGVWTATLQGKKSGVRSVVYFKIYAP